MSTVIAIDGPAGSGKSSTAREVARRLGYTYIDTGAMYRAITWEIIQQKIAVSNQKKITAVAQQAAINFQWIDAELHTFLNGKDISRVIRTSAVSDLVSPVSAIPGVRQAMVAEQRKLAEKSNVVMEGRDIGTHVFPQADFKFYINAELEVRANRRLKDYHKVGQDLSLHSVIAELKRRDQIDSSRSHSPLKKAPDAVVIDTTDLDFEEQVKLILDYVRSRIE